MNTLPKKVLRQMIQENGLKNVDDFHSFLKNLIFLLLIGFLF